jgi:hypothetical protein
MRRCVIWLMANQPTAFNRISKLHDRSARRERCRRYRHEWIRQRRSCGRRRGIANLKGWIRVLISHIMKPIHARKPPADVVVAPQVDGGRAWAAEDRARAGGAAASAGAFARLCHLLRRAGAGVEPSCEQEVDALEGTLRELREELRLVRFFPADGNHHTAVAILSPHGSVAIGTRS